MKSIYVIRNKINDKVYVGQSNDLVARWYHHISETKLMIDKMPIHEAMREFGIENFYYEILESNVDDAIAYEREKYWIRTLNAIYPNGYNVNVDGFDHSTSILDVTTLNSIISDLTDSTLSLTQIAQKNNIALSTVRMVNIGQTYHNPNLKYPLRDTEYSYSDELVKQIKYSLKYEYDKSMLDIAKEYNVDHSQVSELNQGHLQRYAVPGETYPLRSGKVKTATSPEIVQNVMNDLTNLELSEREIAKKYNISLNTVSNINLGNCYYTESVQYPIRPLKKNSPMYNKTIPIPIVKEIENDLANSTLSLRSIATKYSTTYTQIHNLNNGYINKYRDPNKNYPLRGLRRYK